MKRRFIKKKCISLIIAMLMLLPVFRMGVSADEGQAVNVYIDGQKYTGTAMLRNSVTYVGIREFSTAMGNVSVEWDDGTKTATVKSDNLSISSKNSGSYIIANERYLWAQSGIFIISGTMYVPLRTIAKAFNADVSWSSKEFSAYVVRKPGTIASGKNYYNADDVYWLSRIISAEAGVEPFYGKVAVGTVVLNRVKSSQYPNTIYGVIFDRKFGVQFTPAANGTVYNEPDTDSIIAAKLCLDGASISEKVLFFVNDAIAESSWVRDNRSYVTTIGSHNFYA